MLASTAKLDGNAELIENSGIQFVDYELEIDWEDATLPARKHGVGHFLKGGSGEDEPLVRLRPMDGEPAEDEEIEFLDPSEYRVDVSLERDGLLNLPMGESLSLYDGVWFPVPFFNESLGQQLKNGPLNWARCRIVDVTERVTAEREAEAVRRGVKDREKTEELSDIEKLLALTKKKGVSGKRIYRVVFAFDTSIQDRGGAYYAPSQRDVESGAIFSLCKCGEFEALRFFLKKQANGIAWINEWAESVFRTLAKERLEECERLSKDEIEKLMTGQKLHQAHYLNVLAMLSGVLSPHQVRIIANSGRAEQSVSPVGVSLVLDVGNSRSCGIFTEHFETAVSTADDLSNTHVLALRDLNTPEEIYQEPFISRVEFTEANFDFDGKSARSGRTDAFNWPSIVRVGTEAARLSAHRHGNEGNTGLGSPKRYLWNKHNDTGTLWSFNAYSYQIKSKKLEEDAAKVNRRAFALPLCSYINSNGDALFALKPEDNRYCQSSAFSYRSTMTFMLIEVILQAIVQMNSVAHRKISQNSLAPRQLQSVILTVPPAMPQLEREELRSCVYEALGVLWKCLGYDKTGRDTFNFVTESEQIYPPVPEVSLDWNEAEAGQVVYLYNETQKVFHGHCREFIESLERFPADRPRQRFNEPPENKEAVENKKKPLACARIASVDIGGGTTDLVIRDYTFPRDRSEYESNIVPYEVLAEGSRIAGDDIVHDIIRFGPIAAIEKVIAESGCRKSGMQVLKPLLSGMLQSAQENAWRQQLVMQVFTKVALRIMFHVEHALPDSEDWYVRGTVRDFLLGTEVNEHIDPKQELPAPAGLPQPEPVEWFNSYLQEQVRGFSLLDLPLEINLSEINRILAESGFDICNTLSSMCELISLYDVDVLLLTGRPSRLPGVRQYFLQRLALSPARIISMHRYQCEGWYPFADDGMYIGDPKTTASVGALLSHLRLQHTNFPNFHYVAQPNPPRNQMHYVGALDNKSKLASENELFVYADDVEAQTYTVKRILEFTQNGQELPLSVVTDNKDLKPYKEVECNLLLAVSIGYRQFADPSFNAQPLYFIEGVKSVEEVEELIRARHLFASQLSLHEIVEQISSEELRRKYGEALRTLEAQTVAVPEETVRSEISATVRAEVEARVRAAHEKDKGGLFAKLRASKVEQEILSEIDSEMEKEQGRIEALVAQRQENTALEIRNQQNTLMGQALQENVLECQKRLESQFKRLLPLINGHQLRFKIVLQPAVIRSAEGHPFPYLKKELQERMPPVVTFTLKSVTPETAQPGLNEVRPFFRMGLKTCIEPIYWTDNGCIL